MRDTARSQLWPLPVLAIAVAVVGGVLLPRLDGRVDEDVPRWLDDILFGGDAGAASTLLDAIASSLITVTSLTFSLTVVTLQLASSQFSPRLLRTFTSDVFVQATLAVFLATFSYSLTVLRAVRSGDGGTTAFVPRVSVTLAFGLAVASVVMLVLFLAHLARQLRVETMLRDVHDDADAVARSVTEALADAQPRPGLPEPPAEARRVTAPDSGFLTGIDEDRLLAAAIAADALVLIDRHPGSSLVRGTPIGLAWPDDGTNTRLDRDAFETIRTAIGDSVRIGYERTGAQDIGYGLRQLTDVANKALSPGVNDPTTAVHTLGHIAALLCELGGRALGEKVLCDDEGRARVVLRRPTFADLLDVAITQPRRYGSGDPQVVLRLFGLLEDLAWRVTDTEAISVQLARLRASAAASDFDDVETEQLALAAQRVDHALRNGADADLR